jgi:hypothetical protein
MITLKGESETSRLIPIPGSVSTENMVAANNVAALQFGPRGGSKFNGSKFTFRIKPQNSQNLLTHCHYLLYLKLKTAKHLFSPTL